MSAANNPRLESLALAIATGSSTIKDWGEANGVSRRTAYRYANLPGVQARARAIQDDLVAKAVGKLARHAATAVATLARLQATRSGAPESVQAAAAKAILSSLSDMRTQDIKARLAEHNARLDRLEREAKGGQS